MSAGTDEDARSGSNSSDDGMVAESAGRGWRGGTGMISIGGRANQKWKKGTRGMRQVKADRVSTKSRGRMVGEVAGSIHNPIVPAQLQRKEFVGAWGEGVTARGTGQ